MNLENLRSLKLNSLYSLKLTLPSPLPNFLLEGVRLGLDMKKARMGRLSHSGF